MVPDDRTCMADSCPWRLRGVACVCSFAAGCAQVAVIAAEKPPEVEDKTPMLLGLIDELRTEQETLATGTPRTPAPGRVRGRPPGAVRALAVGLAGFTHRRASHPAQGSKPRAARDGARHGEQWGRCAAARGASS